MAQSDHVFLITRNKLVSQKTEYGVLSCVVCVLYTTSYYFLYEPQSFLKYFRFLNATLSRIPSFFLNSVNNLFLNKKKQMSSVGITLNEI